MPQIRNSGNVPLAKCAKHKRGYTQNQQTPRGNVIAVPQSAPTKLASSTSNPREIRTTSTRLHPRACAFRISAPPPQTLAPNPPQTAPDRPPRHPQGSEHRSVPAIVPDHKTLLKPPHRNGGETSTNRGPDCGEQEEGEGSLTCPGRWGRGVGRGTLAGTAAPASSIASPKRGSGERQGQRPWGRPLVVVVCVCARLCRVLVWRGRVG
jgi:hypothetical protein